MRAGNIYVVGFSEAFTERDFASEEFDVEGGPWEMSVSTECQGISGGVVTSVVDKGVDMPWTGLDLLKSLLNRFITIEIDLDRFDGAGRLWTFLVDGVDG